MADNMFVNMQNQAREDVVNSNLGVYPERSVFPYGSGKITSLNEGALVPVDCFFCLPGDSIDIEWTSYLESLNPFVDRMYSGMKLSIHAYYNKCEHEWKGWKNYATRGRRGNSTLSLPVLDVKGVDGYGILLLDGHQIGNGTSRIACQFDVPFGLANHLVGIVNTHISNQPRSSFVGSTFQSLADSYGLGDNTQVNRSFRIDGETVTTYSNGFSFNAIPFAMYQRIYRDFYLNQNLCKDNDMWFPDDEDDFCLPYSIGASDKLICLHAKRYDIRNFSLVPNNVRGTYSLPANDYTTKTADGATLAALRYRQWQGDVFTTSVPFLERNGVTSLFSVIKSGLFSAVHPFDGSVSALGDFPLHFATGTTAAPTKFNFPSSNSAWSNAIIYDDTNNAELFSMLSFNEIQELAASTLWSRRNADAKGDYNSLIRAHYGIDPDSEDRSPRYLGGSIQRLEFNSVLSSVETSSSPLGTKASIASSGGRGSSTHFECPDFGYVMIIASLVPDTFYTQGLRPEFDPLLRGSELPWPEFANLQKQNLLLQRLYYSGDATYDSRLIGFTERFIDYKYRDNRLSGHFNDFMDSKFRSMTFARYFDPSLMQSFMSIDNEFVTLTPYNCRSDMYSVPSQPHFVLQFGDNVRLVRCLPYAAKEATLTNIA